MDRRNIVLLIALTAVLFGDVLFLGRGFYRGDLYVYHFPMKKVVHDLGLRDGIPQWNPAFEGGQPLAANPAYELFYPPQWLIYLPWFLFGFQLHILVHFSIAGVGMYLFLRSLEVRPSVAMFGAVTFAFGAPYLSLIIRLPFLFAMTWVPWVLMFARRAILAGSRRDIALGAIVFGMQAMLGEPVTVLQTGALAGSYVLYRWCVDRDRRRALGALARVAILLAAGFAIAAVQLVPAFDHAGDSVRREGFSWTNASNWSTPPARLAELAYPRLFRALRSDDGGQAIRRMYVYRVQPFISEIYIGLLMFVAAIAGLMRRTRGRWYVVSLLAVSLILSFGDHLPLFRLLHDSGLTKSIRYPEKFLLTALFVLLVWGSVTLNRLIDDAALRRTAVGLVIAWIIIAGLIFVSANVPESVPRVAEAKALDWKGYWGTNAIRAAFALVLLSTAARRRRWWSAALVAFVVADMSFMHFADAERVSRKYFDEPKAAHGISERSEYRLFHKASHDENDLDAIALSHFIDAPNTDVVMRDAMFRFAPAAFGFRGLLEQDLDRTALLTSTDYQRAVDSVRMRTGVWHPYFLESANVRWIAEFVPLAEAKRIGQPIVIRDIGPHPRYWFARRLLAARDGEEMAEHIVTGETRPDDAFIAGTLFDPAAGNVLHVDEHPSLVRLDTQAAGHAFLVISLTGHKYWKATIDGASAALVKTNAGFQGLEVPAGRHSIELRYRNPLIVPSLFVSIIALGAAIAFALRDRAGHA